MDEAMSILKEYISMENIFFIPFLIIIGNIIKKSKRIDDTLIPNVLITLGIFLCSLVSFSQNQPINWIQWIILISVSIGQGVCVSGCAVFINQWFKQNQKYKLMKSFDGDVTTKEMKDVEHLDHEETDHTCSFYSGCKHCSEHSKEGV